MATISRNEDVCFGRNRDSRVEAQVVEEYEGNAECINLKALDWIIGLRRSWQEDEEGMQPLQPIQLRL